MEGCKKWVLFSKQDMANWQEAKRILQAVGRTELSVKEERKWGKGST